MDGLFEILIILAIFLLPALEGMIKRRRQGGAEPGEGSTRQGGEGRRAGSGVATGPERQEPADVGSPSAADRSAEERGAEELLPDDLWAILTGEERPKPRAEAPDDPSSTSLERGEPARADAVDAAPGGADLGGMMSGEPTYDSSYDSYGYDVGGYGAEAETYRYESAAAEGSEATEPTRADVFGELGTGMDAAEGSGAGALTRPGSPGTSGLRRTRASELQQIRTGRMARRGADAAGRGSGLHPFFEGLNRRELRRAVVLQEVLGPPLGLRDEKAPGPPPGLRE